jgi:hypothetical protein
MQSITQGRDLENGVLLIVFNGKEPKDATPLIEKDEDEMLIVIERNIQEFKDKQIIK